MYKAISKVRVRYAETDKMGYVYYGVYPQYFEVGRVEALRELGMSYLQMENEGTMLPVRNLEINYHLPAFYDDLLTVETSIESMPNTRIVFNHKVVNEAGQTITTGKVTLVFVNAETMRPKKAPDDFLRVISPFF